MIQFRPQPDGKGIITFPLEKTVQVPDGFKADYIKLSDAEHKKRKEYFLTDSVFIQMTEAEFEKYFNEFFPIREQDPLSEPVPDNSELRAKLYAQFVLGEGYVPTKVRKQR